MAMHQIRSDMKINSIKFVPLGVGSSRKTSLIRTIKVGLKESLNLDEMIAKMICF
jgi:hypothetical protein